MSVPIYLIRESNVEVIFLNLKYKTLQKYYDVIL